MKEPVVTCSRCGWSMVCGPGFIHGPMWLLQDHWATAHAGRLAEIRDGEMVA